MLARASAARSLVDRQRGNVIKPKGGILYSCHGFLTEFFMTSSRGDKQTVNTRRTEEGGRILGLESAKLGSLTLLLSHTAVPVRAWLTRCPATSHHTESCWSSGYK